jgi:hypothetical protein
VIPFGDIKNVDDWYNPTTLSTLRMDITAGTAGTGGVVDIVTEQYRKY